MVRREGKLKLKKIDREKGNVKIRKGKERIACFCVLSVSALSNSKFFKFQFPNSKFFIKSKTIVE